MTYTIRHTHEGGTLIEGTERGDSAIGILKSSGWRWSRALGQWFIPRTRDSFAPWPKIEMTVGALERAGLEVVVEIDDEARPTAQVEADRAERVQARTQALREKAQRVQARAAAAWERSEAAVRSLPPGGEPIKVGHHSEGRHRRALERARLTMGAAVVADEEAASAVRRAQVSSAAMSARFAPVTVASRIERLEAERRRLVRQKVTATQEQVCRLAAQLASTDDQLAYWREVRESQVASGVAAGLGPESVRVGDLVQVKGWRWERVARVNRKTVTVRDADGWESRVPFSRLTARRDAVRA